MKFFQEFGPSVSLKIPNICSTKDYLKTNLHQAMLNCHETSSLQTIFQLPCEIEEAPSSSNVKVTDQSLSPSSLDSNASTPLGKIDKEKDLIIGANMKRNSRLREHAKGFKKATCSKKNCHMCESSPPSIPASLIRNLGSQFCKIDPQLLSDANLRATKKSSVPIGQKKSKKSSKDKDHDKTDQSKKKAKK
ncbi:hypothetical protein BS78_04G108100 [Paspalum vaginatum]|nr:hypothetical protein BS78_04G108100 [Paspalum vaginatum]